MTAFLMIFRRFPSTFRRLPKILQNCFEGQTNDPEHFPRISEDVRRLPKAFEEDSRMFRWYANKFKFNLRKKNNNSKWHTRTPTHGPASTLCMRTVILPGPWQPWTAVSASLLGLGWGKRMDLLCRLYIFSPMKENKKFTNVLTRNISELAALKLVMSWQKKLLKYCCRHCGTYGNRK